MKFNQKETKLWLGSISKGNASLTLFALLAAISVLASGCGGSSSSTTPPVTLPSITTFTASASSINSGASTTLSWTVTNATSVAIVGVNQVTGASTTLTLSSGSSVSVSPAETTTYALTATDSSGSVTAKTAVAVNNVVSTLNCTTGGTLYTVGTGTTTVNVAVAANFLSPMLFWLNNYFYSPNNNSNFTADSAAYKMDVCSDSTGNFEAAIAANTYEPNIFFAADTTNEGASYATESTEYAQGYPILLGYTSASGKAKTITGITDLIQGQTGTFTDVSATIASGSLATLHFGTLITTGTPGTLIADPVLAPYGVAAANIVNAISGAGTVTFTTGATGTVSVYPSWMENPNGAGLSTITKAYNAIGTSTGAPTGFAAFSAVCTGPPTGAVWIRFTGSDVLTKQGMANLEFNPGGGTEIYNLIKTEMNDTNQTWLKYITTNYGYGSCYAGI